MTTSAQTNLSTIRLVDSTNYVPKDDLSGRTFGRLDVIAPYGLRNRTAFYQCSCSCGSTFVIVSGTSLRSGKTTSCGCYHADKNRLVHFIDITGNKYGRLTAISFSRRKSKKSLWWAMCDCGVTKEVDYSHLVGGRTKSCGCIKRELLQARSGEQNHLWRGGVSYGKWAYPKEWNDTLRTNIRNRDRHKCQYPNCNYEDVLGKKKLDVHHIDGNKQNCESFNLISLCHSHHMSVEMSPRSWEDCFYNITRDYE